VEKWEGDGNGEENEEGSGVRDFALNILQQERRGYSLRS
jgi:hypothetical protein